MTVARRLYVYGVSAFSLFAFAIGFCELLAVLLDVAAEALGVVRVLQGGSSALSRLSLAIALVVVGSPIWAIHWWFAERSVARGTAAERSSTIRAAYFLLVNVTALSAGIVSGIWVVSWLLRTAVDSSAAGELSMQGIAILLVAWSIWGYHAHLRLRDLRATQLTGGPAWVSRLERHAGVLVGLVVGTAGAMDAIVVTLRVLIDRPLVEGVADWWQVPLTDALARAAVGLAACAVSWRVVEGVIRDREAIGEDDRESRVRASYFGTVLVIGGVMLVVGASEAVWTVAAWSLGVAEGDWIDVLVEQVLGPPIAVVPWALVVRWHVKRFLAEGRAVAAREGAERLVVYLAALVSLVFLAGGTVSLIGLLVRTASGEPSGVPDWGWEHELAHASSLMITGGLPWAWSWPLVRARRRSRAERQGTSARAYLFVVVGATLVAGVPAATIVLHRLLNAVLGADPTARLGAELATPLGVVVVATLVGIHHAGLLRRDIGEGRPIQAPSEGPAEQIAEQRLILRGPVEADFALLIDQLGRSLPEGYALLADGARRVGPLPTVDDPAMAGA